MYGAVNEQFSGAESLVSGREQPGAADEQFLGAESPVSNQEQSRATRAVFPQYYARELSGINLKELVYGHEVTTCGLVY